MTDNPSESPTRDEDLRERLIEGLMQRARGLSRDSAARTVDYISDPTTPVTISGVMRVAEVSKPTAIKYRDLVVSALENGPEVLNPVTTPEPPEPSEAWRAQNAEHVAAAEVNRRKEEHKRLDAAEMQRIIDKQIRALDATGGSASQIKALAELKIKFEGLEGSTEEKIVDPHLVLGPRGLPGMASSIGERLNTLLFHRREIPDVYGALVRGVLTTIEQDLADERLSEELRPHVESLCALFSSLPDHEDPPSGAVDAKEGDDGDESGAGDE